MDLAWLSLLALIAVVIISCTSRVNPGLVAIALAWGIVLYAGTQTGNKLDIKTLIGGFPAELFLTLLGVTLLFTQAEVNGTLARVAAGAQQLCRGNRGLIPVMFFLFAAALGTVGPGNIAVAGLIAPVAMAAAVRMNISPLLMAMMVGHGAIASTVSPLTAAGIVASGILQEMGLSGHQWEVFAYNAGANALAALLGFSLCGGWQLLFSRTAPMYEKAAGYDVTAKLVNDNAAADRHLQLAHWITLTVITGLVVGVIGFQVHIGLGAFAGAVILSVFQLADEKEAFQKVPWSVIVMVCGVSMLTALLDKTGGTQRFAGIINHVSTPGTATAILAFTTGLVSVYSSTTGVVLPAFLPMVKELAAVQTGSDPLALASSVLVGGNLVDMSPLSTIGALCLAGAPATVNRRRLFNQLLAWGFVMAFFGALISWVCFSLLWRG
ncbi:hypothetical protein ETAA8_37560 [Anatilimnocola aggregata]|uniref:Dicarboxylate carrier MatC N-terminal domain-containing protein n=1 Tax=Anatilimnocola aggregata TaxID=2528021 RepID=A0A517YEK4_9BACT|nr:SLC13 family permease [Anatilimnocola aggregata]QDU28653.1 hypothetical protein ETAA8_37560 [Anatilimnocola aggregata]